MALNLQAQFLQEILQVRNPSVGLLFFEKYQGSEIFFHPLKLVEDLLVVLLSELSFLLDFLL